MKQPSSYYRTVRRILPRSHPHWVGDGFKVYPVFADLAFTKEISPFLMFDYAEPKRFDAKPVGTKPLGVGQHPHRGFETVTIAFQGEVEHQDNAGNSGVIGPGDVQWMTAGRGILHEEYHSKSFTEKGGIFEMCQLWVNLKARDKMTPPQYQSILQEQIPTVPLYSAAKKTDEISPTAAAVASARIIAGELHDAKGPASTFSPVQVWDVTLPQADSVVELPFSAHHNGMLFVRRGKVQVLSGTDDSDGTPSSKSVLGPQDVALLSLPLTPDDATVSTSLIKLRVLEADSSVMVLGGEPINEPIAAHGPFVMNTDDEIRQAFVDFRSGSFGR